MLLVLKYKQYKLVIVSYSYSFITYHDHAVYKLKVLEVKENNIKKYPRDLIHDKKKTIGFRL